MKRRSTYRLGLVTIMLLLVEVFFWGALVGIYMLIKQFDPSLTLHYQQWLPALLILPVMSIFFMIYLSWSNRAMKRLADLHLVDDIAPQRSPGKKVARFVLWRLAIGFLLVAVLDPKVGSRIEEVETNGIDLMIAVDVSNSMLAEDLKPNRLELAKRTIKKLVSDMSNHRVGLIIFAGDAYVQLPITSDTQAAKIFIDAIKTNSVPTQGTAIGRAIDLSMESFDQRSEAGRAIVLITDGENHEDDAIEAAQRAAEQGIHLYAVGAGIPGGAPIPEFNTRGQRIGFKSDSNGNTIVSQLNESMLVELVTIGDGVFVRSSPNLVDLRPIIDGLNELEKGDLGTASFTDHEHRFIIFALIGMLLIILESLIGDRRWNQKISIA